MISLPPLDCTDWLTTGKRCKLASVEEAGNYLAATIASMVILSCGLRYPGPVSTLRVTCPSAIMMSTWYWPPLSSTISTAASTIGANDVGPAIDHKQ
jgi:hypothetical protein